MTLSELLDYTTLQMYTFRKVLGKDKFKEFMNYMDFKFNQDEFEKNYRSELAKKPTLIQYRKFGQFMCL